MRENTLRKIWARGEAVVNGWLSIPSSFSAEVMAHQGFDSLTVDMQHGVIDYQTAVTMLQAISTTPVIPLARVPWNDPALLMKILDAGVYGVICPMINTRAQAEALVAACKYAPRGYRSWGPVRASIYAGADYGDHANDDLIVMPMIETAEAVKNIDEILSVPGVDAVYVGPSDLSLTMGCKPRLDQTDPPVVEAQQKIVEACKRHGVAAGIHNGDRRLRAEDDRGRLPVRDPRERQPLHGGQGRRRGRGRAQDRRDGRQGARRTRSASRWRSTAASRGFWRPGGRVLATVQADGAPLAMPMWFLHGAETLTMISVADTQKVRNLRRDARVCVVAEDVAGGEVRGVTVQGRVEFLVRRSPSAAR